VLNFSDLLFANMEIMFSGKMLPRLIPFDMIPEIVSVFQNVPADLVISAYDDDPSCNSGLLKNPQTIPKKDAGITVNRDLESFFE
jgi:hypothetical protein